MPSVYHLLARQIPAHIQQAHPVFCKFIEYYYRWLQTRGFVSLSDLQNIDSVTNSITIKDSTVDPIKYLHHTISNGSAKAEVVGVDQDRLIIRYLTSDAKFALDDNIHIRANSEDKYTDDQYNNLDRATISQVETLPSAFIDHFSKMLDSDQIFGTHTPNIATILRNVRSLYKAKGSERALKYLIKATKNIDVEIKYPWDNVLRLSDGRWNQKFCITVATDPNYWHYVPLQIDHIRLMYDEEDDYGNQKYKDFAVGRIEVFAKQSENYDHGPLIDENAEPFTFDTLTRTQFDEGYWTNGKIINFDEITAFDDHGPYWNRDEWYGTDKYKPYDRDPVSGAIIFNPGEDRCYGTFGDRKVNMYIRFYLEEDPNASINQEVRVIEKNDLGQEYVSYVGNVVYGIDSVSVKQPGKYWQAGQIFTASKEQIWYTYTDPNQKDERNVSLINNKGIPIEYSIGKPLIGRVLTTADNGAIKTVEILQYGDHIPYGAGKTITISPLSGCAGQSTSEMDAQIELTYSTVGRNAGFFDDFSGWLSCNDIRIQDSDYYQQFSYDIIANVDGNEFKDIANLLHPAGTKMFTAYIVDADLNAQVGFDIDVYSPWQHVSLVEVANVTEKLTKLFIKNLHEYVNVEEFLEKTVYKNLKERAALYDGDGENNIMYSLELNYDNPDEDYKWVERTVDAKTFKKTSYVDSGFIHSLHINYDQHYVPDVPVNPFPEVTKGGFVKLFYCDGINIIKRSLDKFYNKGEKVILEFIVTNPTRYHFDKVAAATEDKHQLIDVTTKTIGENHYQATFEMPDSDVVANIEGSTLRWPVVVQFTEHGDITPSKVVAFKGEQITIETKPDDRYALGSLFYQTKHLGTTYITETKKFIMPDEVVTIGASFISNGGTVKLKCPTSLNVSVWANNKKIGENDFIRQGTEIELRVGSTAVYTFNGATYNSQDGSPIYIDRENPRFSMVNYDIVIVIDSEVKTNRVSKTCRLIGMHAKGTLQVQPEGFIKIGTECKVIADPGLRSELDKLYYEEIKPDGSKITHILANNAMTQQVFTFNVGLYPIIAIAEFKPTGGYVNNDIEYENNVITTPRIGTWVNMGENITINVPPVEGMTFKSLIYCDEENLYDGGDKTVVTELPHTFKMGQLDVYITDVIYTPVSSSLTIQQSVGGTITLSSQGSVLAGTTINVTASANDRYRLVKLIYSNSRGTFDITKEKTFVMPAVDTTVSATWDKYIYDLNNVKSSGGTILLTVDGQALQNGVNRVNKGKTVVIGSKADSGYNLVRLTYNSGSGEVDITNNKEFVMPAANVTFNAVWERAHYSTTLNVPQKQGVLSPTNGSQQSYDQCYITTTVDGKIFNGSTPNGAVKSTAVNVGDVVNIDLVSIPVANPQNGGTVQMVIQSVVAVQKTTNQNIIQLNSSNQGSSYFFRMPPDDVTVTATVSPSFKPA